MQNASYNKKKEVKRVDKNGKEISKTIFYRLKFIDSTKFMVSSLSNIVNILTTWIHKLKCKNEHDDKKHKTCGMKYKDCDCFFEYIKFKDNLRGCKCLCCNKN